LQPEQVPFALLQKFWQFGEHVSEQFIPYELSAHSGDRERYIYIHLIAVHKFINQR